MSESKKLQQKADEAKPKEMFVASIDPPERVIENAKDRMKRMDDEESLADVLSDHIAGWNIEI